MLRIAHRGASAEEPENTLKAFKVALKSKPDMIEVDVRITKDGVVVAMHDKKINRTTNGKGTVHKLTHEELSGYHAPYCEKIPTLQEVFSLLHGKAKINVDIKDKKAVKPTIKLINDSVKKGMFSYNDFLLSAFGLTILLEVRRYQPRVAIAFNFIAFPSLFLFLTKIIGAKVAKPHKRITNKKLVDAAHRLGIRIYVWTVNSEEDAEKMEHMGVDGIVTDFPDLIEA